MRANLNIEGRKGRGQFLISVVIIAFILSNFISLQSCLKPDDTQAIKDTLKMIVHLAEKKDRDKILNFLTSDYLDFEG
ncbi:MAG: hypothetical protein ACPLRA_07525, partial [Candidatus Saccharicenans sp.]